jgi:hypothetical protein
MLSLKIAQSSESEEESSSKKQEILESNPPIVNRSLLKLNSSLFDDDKSPEKSYLLRNGKVKPKKINKEPEGIVFFYYRLNEY